MFIFQNLPVVLKSVESFHSILKNYSRINIRFINKVDQILPWMKPIEMRQKLMTELLTDGMTVKNLNFAMNRTPKNSIVLSNQKSKPDTVFHQLNQMTIHQYLSTVTKPTHLTKLSKNFWLLTIIYLLITHHPRVVCHISKYNLMTL